MEKIARFAAALALYLFALAAVMGMGAIVITAGWYGFGLRDGAMFAWSIVGATICAVPMIGVDMIAMDIVNGR